MTKISVSGWTTFTQSAIKLPLPGFKASDQYSNGQYSNMRTLILKFFLFPSTMTATISHPYPDSKYQRRP